MDGEVRCDLAIFFMRVTMKFTLICSAFLLLFSSVGFASYPSNDPVFWGTEEVPDFFDAINSRILTKEMEKPEHYPAYLYKPQRSLKSKIERYLVDGKVPSGPIQCEHFKIVYKKNEAPVTWEERNTRASNVYYHLHRAIDYFGRLSVLLGQPIYQEKKPVVVRLDMDVDWAMWIKFSNQVRYNTSQTFPDADPDKWGTLDEQREIWFFIPKRLYAPWFIPMRYIPGLRDTVAGTIGFPLDSAHVPSVIYHEWTHLMTRPYLDIKNDSVLNEGYSDYYGSVIWGRPNMGDTEEFSTFPYARDYHRDPGPARSEDYKTPGNFVPSFFWYLRGRFGADRTDVLLWKVLQQFNPKSLLGELPGAILKSADSMKFSQTEMAELRMQMLKHFPPLQGRKGS